MSQLQSERICFADTAIDSSLWKKELKRFMETVPEEKRPLVRWVIKMNGDPDSEEYNPLGSWGRFQVVEENPADEFMKQYLKYQRQ